MEVNQKEMEVLNNVVKNAAEVQQLTDLQLALVGGGIADVIAG